MRRLEVRQTFPYSPIGGWRNRGNPNPFSLVSVFQMDGDEYMLKGGWSDIRRYLENVDQPLMIAYSHWYHGRSRRDNRSFKNIPGELQVQIHRMGKRSLNEPPKKHPNHEWEILVGTLEKFHFHKTYRRAPSRWPVEITKYIKKEMEKNDVTPHRRFASSLQALGNALLPHRRNGSSG